MCFPTNFPIYLKKRDVSSQKVMSATKKLEFLAFLEKVNQGHQVDGLVFADAVEVRLEFNQKLHQASAFVCKADGTMILCGEGLGNVAGQHKPGKKLLLNACRPRAEWLDFGHGPNSSRKNPNRKP